MVPAPALWASDKIKQVLALRAPCERNVWSLQLPIHPYRSIIQADHLVTTPGKRVEKLAWVKADEAAADASLAFDHAALVAKAVEATRVEFQALRFPAGFMPALFTLAELQLASEVVLGRALDKSSFRRRVDDAGCVRPVDGSMRIGAFRPAQMYEMLTP